MSRAHETFLRNQIGRLDRWIAESEALASRTSDEETLQSLNGELVRWRESRVQLKKVLSRAKSLNRFASWALAAFCISFAMLMVFAYLRLEGILLILIAINVLFMIGASTAFIIAIAVRDAIALGRRPWQFSLWNLFVTTTVIAMFLGLLVYTLKQ